MSSKEIYLCADFNIDLLQIETKQNYNQFYDMLCSYVFYLKLFSLLVTGHHTLIVFSNNR